MNSTEALQGMHAFLPEMTLAVGAIVLLMIGLFSSHKATPRFVVLTAWLLVMVGILLAPALEPTLAFHGMLVADGFTQFAKVLIIISAVLVVLISSHWMTDKGRPFELLVLLCFSTLGLMLLVSAQDLLTLYMALELAALPSYVLAASERDDTKSNEAGMKYFILGALSSCILLFGISLTYGFAGSTSLDDIGTLLSGSGEVGEVSHAIILGMVLVFIGFCFKISAVPFHMWTPDVYEGSPTPVVAFFATAPKVAALMLLIRLLLQPFGDVADQWQQLVIFASVASMLVGAFGGLMQTDIKRLLAYSSIGHIGFMLMGLAANTIAGVQSIGVYLGVYIFMSIGAFGCLMLMRRDGHAIVHMRDLAGLSKIKPRSAMLMAAFMFAMAGIPPLSGFFGKMVVVQAAMTSGLIWLALVGLACSVVACFYYLRVVKVMYFDEVPGEVDIIKAPLTRFAVIVSATITLAYVLQPALLMGYAKTAADILIR